MMLVSWERGTAHHLQGNPAPYRLGEELQQNFRNVMFLFRS